MSGTLPHASQLTSSVLRPRIRGHRDGIRHSHGECSTKSDVASLSAHAISEMNRDELLDVIVAGRLPLLSEERIARLEKCDRKELEVLARQARRVCRMQGY